MRERFHDNGFVIIPSVLDDGQVRGLREYWIEQFDRGPRRPGDTDVSRADIYCRHPAMRWLLTHEPIVSGLRGLLGEDYVYLHEMAAHDGHYAGWHKDTTAMEVAGHRFHLEPDYLVAQCAIYLQDNGPRYGGGVDVNPGSHREPDAFAGAEGATRRRDPYTVPSRAGDLVVFDTRLNHQATQPASATIPPEHRKLGLFLLASTNSPHVERYDAWIRSRRDDAYGYLKDHEPDAELQELLRARGLCIGPRAMTRAG